MNNCICCGLEIVEGLQACFSCTNPSDEEMTKEELTAELNKFKQGYLKMCDRVLEIEKELNQMSSTFLKICKQVCIRH